jgi:hypothetical protein
MAGAKPRPECEETEMTSISARGAVAAALSILLCAPAIGQAPTPAPAPRSGADQSEIVCEKQDVIGSRLQKKKVCMTRSEWADLRQQDKQYLEKQQTQRGLISQ